MSQHFGKASFCLVEGDVKSKADVRRPLDSVDVVFHLAAIVSVDFSVKNPLSVNDVGVGGTFNVLEESLKAYVKKFVWLMMVGNFWKQVIAPLLTLIILVIFLPVDFV